MWLFTTQGFYSVVAHRRAPDKLIVRSRAREDLEALREQIPNLRVFSDQTADYRWRAVVTRAEWVAAVAQLATDIDYDNFKNAVAGRQGADRERLYERVWAELRALQH
jgi:D-Tyr-tRNAtyr deacylase